MGFIFHNSAMGPYKTGCPLSTSWNWAKDIAQSLQQLATDEDESVQSGDSAPNGGEDLTLVSHVPRLTVVQ